MKASELASRLGGTLDGEDVDITAYIDLIAQDNLFNTQYSEMFGTMYVSPFPVSDKKILFTREAEEGTLYYLKDDEKEFSYLIDPYYQYHNGVDLRSATGGASIFNLNYGYNNVYLENGLVSFGINRITGQMYLRKWDTSLNEYTSLYVFQLENYDDVNINSISDDRIELQASDTTIIMYRGHPYVILKHRGESINVLSKFHKVYSESVDDNMSDYPVYYDLMNNDNLLPPCVGSKNNIDGDCLSIKENIPSLEDVTITIPTIGTLVNGVDTLYVGQTVNLSVTGINDGTVHFIVDGADVGHCDASTTLPYTFDESKEHEVYAVFVGDETREYDVSAKHIIFAEQIPVIEPEPTPTPTPTPPVPSELSGKWVLEITQCPKTFKYLDHQTVKARLTRGGVPVAGMTVELTVFKHTYTVLTDANGYVSFQNKYTDTYVGNYKIGARFYQNATLIAQDWRDVKVTQADMKWTLIKKAKNNNGYVVVKLTHATTGYARANHKVTMYINGLLMKITTNSEGNVVAKMNVKQGRNKLNTIKLVSGGGGNYNKVTFNHSEKL